MATRKKTVIITYFGVDGACAAAAALLGRPGAEVVVSSMSSIGETLQALVSSPPQEIHCCGLGVEIAYASVEVAARALKQKGTALYWHCGRGYLDAEGPRMASWCTPVLVKADSNTEALALFGEQAGTLQAAFLCALALLDPQIQGDKPRKSTTPQQEEWLDALKGAMAQYFKYHDREPYVEAIRQLVLGDMDARLRRMAGIFRDAGYRYMLHGKSPAMQELKRRIKRCGEVDCSVLITGESGVGKEHVAQLLRESSKRHQNTLVPVNCALYTGNAGLANSDLFGHVKGAFTGAVADRKGRFVEADGGILYLDEIGELSLEVQAKLLRVLQDGQVTPEGADAPQQKVDVRILAATNRDLPQCIREGSFRADLYHRLSTLLLHIPPLRERPEDIRHIVQERLDVLRAEGYSAKLTDKDWAAVNAYDWPGNARQVIKLLDRAVYLGLTMEQTLMEEKALGALRNDDGVSGEGSELCPRHAEQILPLEEVKKCYARQAWRLHNENYSAAARALEVTTNTLRRLVEEKEAKEGKSTK